MQRQRRGMRRRKHHAKRIGTEGSGTFDNYGAVGTGSFDQCRTTIGRRKTDARPRRIDGEQDPRHEIVAGILDIDGEPGDARLRGIGNAGYGQRGAKIDHGALRRKIGDGFGARRCSGGNIVGFRLCRGRWGGSNRCGNRRRCGYRWGCRRWTRHAGLRRLARKRLLRERRQSNQQEKKSDRSDRRESA